LGKGTRFAIVRREDANWTDEEDADFGRAARGDATARAIGAEVRDASEAGHENPKMTRERSRVRGSRRLVWRGGGIEVDIRCL
jgi:plasmid stabilization system protein ParE